MCPRPSRASFSKKKHLTAFTSDAILYVTVRNIEGTMKQFLIDTASNTLTAVALVGALCIAAPAKADTRDVVGGLFLGLILTEVLGNQSQPQHTVSTINPRNTVEPSRECNVVYREGTRTGTWERISYNCLGQIIETRLVN